ncbi:MAG: DEAD/DEAH box helicase, partial [Verrucomicrobia bacterium]|nr:DEAD/DEAH box helicase [Verrucomicrobiota bacterium]
MGTNAIHCNVLEDLKQDLASTLPLAERIYRRLQLEALPHQLEVWHAIEEGASGVLHAPTGSGKTLAVAAPLLHRALGSHPTIETGLRFLWVTPLRALVEDTRRAIEALLRTLKWPGEVQSRCGDTSASIKARQKQSLPSVLITTPESLSLLLSYESTHHAFQGLQAVVVDEWHELLSTKRGVQTELCLARLRQWCPSLQTWGLSATLGNLHEAMQALLGSELDGRLICATTTQLPEVQT